MSDLKGLPEGVEAVEVARADPRTFHFSQGSLQCADDRGTYLPVLIVRPKPGFSYELTASSGRAWVRYLPAGVSVGDARSDFLVVGTYKQPNSYANLERAANRPGGVSRSILAKSVSATSARVLIASKFRSTSAGGSPVRCENCNT